MSILILLIFGFSNVYAHYCTAGNPISTDGTSELSKGILSVGLFYQHSLSDTYYEGAKMSDFTYKSAYYDYIAFRLSYNVSDRFNVSSENGYFQRKGDIFINSGFSRYARGLGDLNLSFRYLAFSDNGLKFLPYFTIKLPVGEFDQVYNNVVLPIDLQPSSGSYRFNPGLFLFKSFEKSDFSFYLNVTFEASKVIETERTQSFKYGNLLIGILFGVYTLSDDVILTLELRNQFRQKSANIEDELDASGGFLLMTVPRLNYKIQNFNVFISSEHPIYRNLNDVGFPQLGNKYAISIGVTKKFNLVKETVFPQEDYTVQYQDSFFLNGLYGMCKERIESVALKNNNVKYAYWEASNKRLLIKAIAPINPENLVYDISTIGLDNECFEADSLSYSNLHSYCKYRN